MAHWNAAGNLEDVRPTLGQESTVVGYLIITWGLRFCSVLLGATVLGIWAGFLMPPLPWPLTFFLILVSFVFTSLHASRSIGFRRALFLMLLTLVASLLVESVGVLTSAVFGPYQYTSVLGPCFLGLVPYSVPMVWFILVYPAYVTAERLVPARWAERRRQLAVAALGATAVTAVDVALDPVMVKAGAWVWHVNGAFFGIPVQNYVGWWMTAFVVVALYLAAGGVHLTRPSAGTASFARLAICSYATIAFGAVSMAFHMRLIGPALLGLVATSAAVVASLRSTKEAQSREPTSRRYERVAPMTAVCSVGARVAAVLCSHRSRDAAGLYHELSAIPPSSGVSPRGTD